ncbi:MAG: DegV family protein [Clostridiales bacterium]|nr:DegV family protein [Clostridiales bacterium]
MEKIMKRKVFCTSTGCLEYAPARYLEQHDIGIIRVHVLFNGKDMLEGLDLDPVDFYKQLEKVDDVKNNLPKTAMPTRAEIMEHFDKAVADGYEELIIIAISSGLGGTYNLIRLVAEEYKEKIKIHVIDAKITCFAEGLLAVKAAELIEKGVDTPTILKEIEWIQKRMELFGIDGRLDYLIYNGRLKGGKAFFGKMLSICPVIHFNEVGELVPLCSVRTQKKALQKTCELLKEIIGDRKSEDYILLHLYTGTSVVDQLVEIEKDYGIETNHERVIMSPVSGCHNGPWLAGYIYVPIRRDSEPLE